MLTIILGDGDTKVPYLCTVLYLCEWNANGNKNKKIWGRYQYVEIKTLLNKMSQRRNHQGN